MRLRLYVHSKALVLSRTSVLEHSKLQKGYEALLVGYLASLLQTIFPGRDIHFHYTQRDIFCYESARRVLLNLVRFALSANLVLKVIWLILKRPVAKKTEMDLDVSVRSKHQARLAPNYLNLRSKIKCW